MREILFRGKRKDNGEWVEGNFQHYPFNDTWTVIVSYDPPDSLGIGQAHYTDVDFSTVGQYTGLTDKNGKRIFEGDICRFKDWKRGPMCWIGKVHWEHQQFVISGGPNKECATPFTLVMSRFGSESIEVIGNIHDNPELLNGGSNNA